MKSGRLAEGFIARGLCASTTACPLLCWLSREVAVSRIMKYCYRMPWRGGGMVALYAGVSFLFVALCKTCTALGEHEDGSRERRCDAACLACSSQVVITSLAHWIFSSELVGR